MSAAGLLITEKGSVGAPDAVPTPAPRKDADTRELAILLRASGRGDRAAFKALYEQTSSMLFGLLVTILRDREISREVAQEVYVTIWRRAKTFDAERGNPISWMRTIARTRATDRIRAERARSCVLFTDEVPDIADLSPGAEASVDAVAVRRALETLRPEYRKVLLLSYFKGYSNTELAALLEIPVGTAKTWVRRGLEDLKTALA